MNKRVITDICTNPYRSNIIGFIATVELDDYDKIRKISDSYCSTPIVSDLINYIRKNKHKQVKLVEIEKIELNRINKKNKNKEIFINYLKEIINSYNDSIICVQLSDVNIIFDDIIDDDFDSHKLEVLDILKNEFGFEYALAFSGYHKSIPLLLGTGIESRKIVKEIVCSF